MNLLIVDDEATNRKLLRAQLEAEGHSVLDATNGVEALEVLEREKSVDGVVSDILMPDMDGFRLCLEVRKNKKFSTLPFIFYTSTYSSPQDQQLAKTVGADNYLSKPSPTAVILGALDEAAQRTRPRIARAAAQHDESYVLKQYNSTLVRKLEGRNVELEETLKQLQLANQNIRESERRRRLFIEHAPAAIAMLDRDMRYIAVSRRWLADYRVGTQDVIGRSHYDVFPDIPEHWKEIHRRCLGGAVEKCDEDPFRRADGSLDWVKWEIHPWRRDDGEVGGIMLFSELITERKEATEKIQRLNRVYAVLSGINTLIVHVTDRQELFNGACRIAVEHGGFGMVWIGLLNREGQEVQAMAQHGFPGDFGEIKVSLQSENAKQWNPAARVISEREPFFDNNITNQPGLNPMRQAAVALGYRSLAILPLSIEMVSVGAMFLYAKEPGFFNNDEIKLLTELAGDISFALDHIGKNEKISRLSRIQAVMSNINSLIVRVRNRQELFEGACRITVDEGRFPFAWIGVLDPVTQDVTPVAWAGKGAEALTRTKSSARDDSPRGKGAVGQAIRGRRPVFNNDIAAHGFGGPRLREILGHGFRSLISLPLYERQTIVGTLTMYAREPGFFDAEELRLLTELAGNISFAMENISRQEKLDKLSRIRAVSSEINAAIVRIHEREALLQETCRIATEHGKFEMIWIGTVDTKMQEIRAVAWTGFSPEVASRVSWKSANSARGALSEAIQTRKPAARNNIELQLPEGGMRSEAVRRGCRSTVCLPVVVDDSVVALIALFAAGTDFFDKDELALLDEVTADVSFALQSIAQQEKVQYLSYYDPLTALPNRALFIDRLGQQMRARSGEPTMIAVATFDIERFGIINDTLGRGGGDVLLKLIAGRLEQTFGGKDRIAHIGGDDFGVVMRGIRDATEVAHMVENQVLGCFREPFNLSGTELRVSIKVGIALHPTDGQDADTLFKSAEVALKRARDSGEGYLFYAAEMNAKAAQALSLETRLRKAVEAQEFVLHYQPKYTLADGKICGIEALIRWQDPSSGLVAPGIFIPLLEETGLITDVGRWALTKALAQHRDWAAAGLAAPRVAVNVSAIQLQQADFADMVISAVQDTGDNSEALGLEVTESLLMKDVQASIRKFSILRGMGIHIAMDDFGTGYSSLSYIARLPINSLKIDRSFITGMATSPQDMSIVTTIIALAHSLNLRVIAEGVETEAQSKLLKLLKCDEAQGYLFSKPLPPDQIEALLRDREKRK